MSTDLVSEFLKRINEPDPPHVLMLKGINSAANWLKGLSEQERKVTFDFIENELAKKGDLPIKEIIIKVLQQVGGTDSLRLLDKIVNEGEIVHGKYLVSDAFSAKSKILNKQTI